MSLNETDTQNSLRYSDLFLVTINTNTQTLLRLLI